MLIDADNFHHPDQLQAAHAQFAQHMGKHFICHAHGSAQVLARDALKPIWQALGARLMPALPLPKNTTDTALVMDALLLHFQYGVTRFGIASGDADFAPLSLQLRELGCEVWCFARMAIAFEHMPSYYDRVVRFDRVPSDSASPPPPQAKLLPAPQPAATPPKPAPASAPAASPVTVAQILKACPALKTQAPQPMNTTVHVLRQRGLMSKSETASKWFAQFGQAFKLVTGSGIAATVCWQAQSQGATPPTPPTPVEPPTQAKPPMLPAARPAPAAPPAPQSWPITVPRRAACPLRNLELAQLRKALLSLAPRKVMPADILQAVPELRTGKPCALGSVASRLREHGLLHESRSALDVLRPHAVFEISLAAAPQAVTYRP